MHSWWQRHLRFPQRKQAIAIVVGCPSELGSKTLLMKVLHALVVGHREIRLKISWKLHSQWPQWYSADCRGALSATVLLSCAPWHSKQDMPIEKQWWFCYVSSQLFSDWNWGSIHMKEFTAGTVNLVRRLVARKVIGASGETTAVVLLKWTCAHQTAAI